MFCVRKVLRALQLPVARATGLKNKNTPSAPTQALKYLGPMQHLALALEVL